MCGIAAAWAKDDKAATTWVKQALDLLRWRGPDGCGQWGRPGSPVLGHTLLAVSAGPDGRQPIVDEAGRFVVTANAEVYDHECWRRRLGTAVGHNQSDCAVIPPLLHRGHIDDVLRGIDGEFALVVWDRAQRVLHLMRDRFGIRPLSFRVGVGMVVASSEERVTAGGLGLPPRIDRSELLAQVVGAVTRRRSLYEGVEVVGPGERVEIRFVGDQPLVRRVRWALPVWLGECADEPLPALDEALVDAVRLRTRTARGIGVYLSGGMDSGAVAAAAVRVGAPVEAWTVSFAGDDPDAARARLVAAWLRLPHHVVTVTRRSLFERYPAAIRRGGHVMSNPLGAARLMLSEAATETGVAVALTGELADELFGGYVTAEVDLARACGTDPGAVYRRLGLPPEALAEEHAEDPLWMAAIGFTPTWLRTWLTIRAEIPPILSEDGRARLRERDAFAEMLEAAGPPRGAHPFDRSCEAWLGTIFERRVGGWATERMDASCGLEGRPLFAAPSIVEAAGRARPEARTAVGDPKRGLRTALRTLLPPPVAEAAKSSFTAPDGIGMAPSGFEPSFRRLLDTYMAPDRVAALGLFDAPQLWAYVRQCEAAAGYERRRMGRLLHHALSAHVLADSL